MEKGIIEKQINVTLTSYMYKDTMMFLVLCTPTNNKSMLYKWMIAYCKTNWWYIFDDVIIDFIYMFSRTL